MGNAKKDYLASLIIGFLAAILSKIMVDNLDLSQKIITRFQLDLDPIVVTTLIMLLIFIACPTGIFVARFIGKKSLNLYQFIKFGETGGLNTFVDLGVFNLLILISGMSTGLVVFMGFKGISFLTAVTNSYFWNKHWVFGTKKEKVADEQEMLKFFIVSITGFLINVGASALFTIFIGNLLSIDKKIIANIGAIVAFALTMMFNFVGYKLFVFVKAKKK